MKTIGLELLAFSGLDVQIQPQQELKEGATVLMINLLPCPKLVATFTLTIVPYRLFLMPTICLPFCIFFLLTTTDMSAIYLAQPTNNKPKCGSKTKCGSKAKDTSVVPSTFDSATFASVDQDGKSI